MPITSTTPGGIGPPDYLRQQLTLSSLTIGEVITGVFDSAADPGTTFSHTVSTTDIEDATADLLLAIENHVSSEIGSGSAWAEVTLSNGVTYIVVTWLETDFDLIFTSSVGGGGGGSMATKIWTGNSTAVAQVTTITPLNVLAGDSFAVKINGKVISVVATASTAANVATLLAAAIAASSAPEWREVTATVSGDAVTLTARTAGVPFTVETASSDAIGIEIRTTVAGAAGVNAVQRFAVPKSAAGTFIVCFGDQYTSALSTGASAGTVQTALQALSTIGSGNATVSKADSSDGNDDVYTVTFAGSLASKKVAELIVDLTSTKPLIRTIQQGGSSVTVQNEKQTIEISAGKTFTLTLNAETTVSTIMAPYTDDISSTLASNLKSLAGVRVVTVTRLSTDARYLNATYEIEFTDFDGTAAQSQITASDYSGSTAGTHRLTITNTQGVNAINEVQTVSIIGNATGGTFTLTYSGQTTSAIAYNASTSTVQSALEALSNIGTGDAVVTGSAGAWIVTFSAALAGTNVAQMTATRSLTGTAATNVTIATPTASSGPNHWDTADNWLPSGIPETDDAVRFEIGNVDCLWGLDQSGITLDSLHISMGWTGQLGLPRVNQSGYLEYRTRELTLGITQVKVGQSSGSGPRKVALNTGTVATTITVIDSGGSSETGVPCVIWRGVHADNVINVQGGEFGSAWWSDETAQISLLTQTDGTVFLKHTTIDDSLDVSGQDFRAFECTLGTKPLNV